MTKYREYVDIMLQNHPKEFEEFKQIHDQYFLDPEANQSELNRVGGRVMSLVRMYEDRLCNRSEGTGYGKYTSSLAEKFNEEVKKHFPKIDCIGIIPFSVKKITLK